MPENTDLNSATRPLEVNLRGKISLVTGSSSGLGSSIAEHLADSGSTVAIHFHSEKDQAQALADRIRKKGGKAEIFQADVSRLAEVQNLFAEIDKKLGPIDILVNNAGIDGKRELVGDDDPGEWESVIGINLFGPYYCSREAGDIISQLTQGASYFNDIWLMPSRIRHPARDISIGVTSPLSVGTSVCIRPNLFMFIAALRSLSIEGTHTLQLYVRSESFCSCLMFRHFEHILDDG